MKSCGERRIGRIDFRYPTSRPGPGPWISEKLFWYLETPLPIGQVFDSSGQFEPETRRHLPRTRAERHQSLAYIHNLPNTLAVDNTSPFISIKHRVQGTPFHHDQREYPMIDCTTRKNSNLGPNHFFLWYKDRYLSPAES